MPRRRAAFGNALSSIGQDLFQLALQQNEQDHQSSLIADRQAEASRQRAREALYAEAVKNPAVARRLASVDPEFALLAPTREEDEASVGESIAKADTLEKVPDPASIVNQYRGLNQKPVDPGETEVDPSTGLNKPHESAIQRLMDQAAARRTGLMNSAKPEERSYINDQGVAVKESVNPYQDIGKVRPTERTAEQEGTRQGNIKVAEAPGLVTATNQVEKGTRGERVRTAGAIAATNQAAQTKGEADRIRQAWELAAQDPAIAATAEAVIKDPTQLRLVQPKDRKYVFQAMQSDRFRSQTQRQAQTVLDTLWSTLQDLKTSPGMEGAVGAKGPSSFFGLKDTPIAGTQAGDYRAKMDRFASAATLSNLDYLKGLGHMSDMEFGTVGKMATLLKTNVSEAMYKQEIPKAEEALRAAYTRAGLTPPPATQTGYQSSAQQKRAKLSIVTGSVR